MGVSPLTAPDAPTYISLDFVQVINDTSFPVGVILAGECCIDAIVAVFLHKDGCGGLADGIVFDIGMGEGYEGLV